MFKDCPHRKGNRRGLHNIEESITTEDMTRETPRIYATLDNHKEDYQATFVEVGGKIVVQFVSIFIDLGSIHSYIHP